MRMQLALLSLLVLHNYGVSAGRSTLHLNLQKAGGPAAGIDEDYGEENAENAPDYDPVEDKPEDGGGASDALTPRTDDDPAYDPVENIAEDGDSVSDAPAPVVEVAGENAPDYDPVEDKPEDGDALAPGTDEYAPAYDAVEDTAEDGDALTPEVEGTDEYAPDYDQVAQDIVSEDAYDLKTPEDEDTAYDATMSSTEIVDMHTHSSFSDGSDPAIEIVRKAKKIGLGLVAITDHDQVTVPTAAIEEAKKLGIKVEVGCEISCEWNYKFPEETGGEIGKVHMLGYMFDTNNKPLNDALLDVQNKREKRNHDIVDILNDRYKLDITFDDVLDQLEGDTKTPGRPHFAKALLKKGFVKDIPEAFEKYLSDEKLALPEWSLTFFEAANLVHKAGGIPVLAHPSSLKIPNDVLKKELAEFMKVAPLKGMECYSSRHTLEQATDYKDMAEELGLLVTGGSDYHGTNKKNIPLGEFGGGDEVWRETGKSRYDDVKSADEQAKNAVGSDELHEGLWRIFFQLFSYACLLVTLIVSSIYVPGRLPQKPQGSMGKFLHFLCIGRPPKSAKKDIEEARGTEASRLIDEDFPWSDDEGKKKTGPKPVAPPKNRGAKEFDLKLLLLYATGLQVSYLTWGFFQERIMTLDYGSEEEEGRFSNSEFLVLLNRVWALCVALIATRYFPNKSMAPLYKFSFASMGNIMSSWFQYEALKYISFPLAMLSKSSKIIVTMLMGKVVQGKNYIWRDYAAALLITGGLMIFRLGGNGAADNPGADTSPAKNVMVMLGFIFICGYAVCDSFVSNWQAKIFGQFKVNSWQMMLGINACSVPIAVFMTIIHSTFFSSIWFMLKFPECLVHSFLMSVCSATGQCFIFLTIDRFGAVSFATIMTLRQVMSIVLSIVAYGHNINLMGILGLGVVFNAFGLILYNKSQKAKAAKK